MLEAKTMPALFIGHGSPMNAIEDNEFSRAWRETATRFPRPAAVLCISAHWETAGVRVNDQAHPRTIHDFYGFPDELFAVRYPAPGSAELTAGVVGLLDALPAAPDRSWGIDHGAWSVLRRMYPDADVPVVQLSLDSSRPGSFHYRTGQLLRPLRDQGVLILGSGNIVHNLGLYDFRDDTPYPWAESFDARIGELIAARRHGEIADYRNLGDDADLAIPTPEHYLPLLHVLGAAADEEPEFFCRKILGSLSMTSVAFGMGTGSGPKL